MTKISKGDVVYWKPDNSPIGSYAYVLDPDPSFEGEALIHLVASHTAVPAQKKHLKRVNRWAKLLVIQRHTAQGPWIDEKDHDISDKGRSDEEFKKLVLARRGTYRRITRRVENGTWRYVTHEYKKWLGEDAK